MHQKKPKLIWRIFPSFLIIILLSLTAVTWYATSYFKDFFLESSERELSVRALLVQDRFARALHGDKLPVREIDDLCKEVGRRINTRITVILPTGEVIGDSFARIETMENHKNRPEIRKAFHGEKGVNIRYSSTLDKTMMYIALPMIPGKKGGAVIRTAVSISDIDTRISAVRNSILIALVFTIIAAALASLYVSGRITKPVEQMRKGAEAFSKGNLDNRLPTTDTEELSQLAKSMNFMAGELDKKIMDVKNRSRELEAIHGSMQEGVIAVDGNEHIITINTAAAKIFDFSPETLKHRNVLEVARNYDLQIFIQKALATHEPVEDDIVIEREERLILNIHSTALYDTNEKRIGTLIIFHDITRIRLLETMHKDFAANVSHELKTPLTTIKGFIETLQQMMEDHPKTDDAQAAYGRFLSIIEKNANRMIGLINDLLALSRLERLKGTDIEFEPHPLASLIQGAVAFCREKALAKGSSLEVQCPEQMTALVDPILMEQAIFNLVDNAVKYNPENTRVTVEVTQNYGQTRIRVRDTGSGIDKEHLPKLFNRFYRVDKGRSRDQGGTGLGL
ncbi:MAG TPA: PAS domain-containing sensor histidine kinase, partial [Desulfobacteraceae bacterium]|nr:PAS domain-containing sensor histidine kinase [Desulfobacteraceae bacterium]